MAGESLARNKYTFFAKQAEKEGLIWISHIFLETADNERAHAEEEFEQIEGKAEMANGFDIHSLGKTVENLKAAFKGETYEYSVMYPEFIKIAKTEGDKEAARLFTEISEVEEKHAIRYKILADLIEKGKLYQRDEEIEWKCLNCGYIHKGKSASEECPLCKKPQGWYAGIGIVR